MAVAAALAPGRRSRAPRAQVYTEAASAPRGRHRHGAALPRKAKASQPPCAQSDIGRLSAAVHAPAHQERGARCPQVQADSGRHQEVWDEREGGARGHGSDLPSVVRDGARGWRRDGLLDRQHQGRGGRPPHGARRHGVGTGRAVAPLC